MATLREGGLEFAVTCCPATGKIRSGPVEILNEDLVDWQRTLPGPCVITVFAISAGQGANASNDPKLLAQLEEGQPVAFALEDELDMDVIAAALCARLDSLHATHGRH